MSKNEQMSTNTAVTLANDRYEEVYQKEIDLLNDGGYLSVVDAEDNTWVNTGINLLITHNAALLKSLNKINLRSDVYMVHNGTKFKIIGFGVLRGFLYIKTSVAVGEQIDVSIKPFNYKFAYSIINADGEFKVVCELGFSDAFNFWVSDDTTPVKGGF